MNINPVVVDIFRSTAVESRHRGAVVAVDASGDTIFELGNIDALVFPRSSLKPFQAIPLVESGAAAHFSLTDRELALACASHNAEPVHQQVLAEWMQRAGLNSEQLECGAALPYDETTARDHLRAGGEPAKHLHNCSGKHTGMLTLAKFLNLPADGYSLLEHPTQQLWIDVLSELSEVDIKNMPWDRDGCGLPAFALPLRALALAFSKFSRKGNVNEKRFAAMNTISNAMRKHPDMVAGRSRCCTATMEATDMLLVKTGAEGVFGGVCLSRGIGFALKIDDGATRAADAALGALLLATGILDDSGYEAMEQVYQPAIKNSQGVVVGKVAASSVWGEL
jgi:L-asparaginase II